MSGRKTIAAVQVVVVLAALAMFFAAPAVAVEIAFDSFNSYPAGELDGRDGGTGFAGAWSVSSIDREEVVADTLQFDAIGNSVAIGGAYNGSTGLNNNPIRRQFATSQTNDVYVSFMWQADNGWDDNDFFILWLDDIEGGDSETHQASSGFLGVRGNGGSNQFFSRVYNAAGGHIAANEAETVSSDSQHFLVGRFYKDSSPNYNKFAFWVDPTSTTLGGADGTATLNSGSSSVDYIGVRTGQYVENADQFLFDHLRVGTAAADVLPTHVASDTFDLPAGDLPLTGNGRGWGFNGRWNRSDTHSEVVNPNTPMQVGKVKGGDQAIEVNGNSENYNAIRRQLASPQTAAANDEVFVRFLFRAQSGFDSNDFVVLWFDETQGDIDDTHQGTSAFIGARGGPNGSFFVRVNDDQNSAFDYTVPDGIVEDQDYMLVGRLFKSYGSDYYDRFSLWVDPEWPRIRASKRYWSPSSVFAPVRTPSHWKEAKLAAVSAIAVPSGLSRSPYSGSTQSENLS